MKKYLTLIFLFLATYVSAQSGRNSPKQKTLDSLNLVINTTKSDTTKCLTYYWLADMYQGQRDSSLKAINAGLRLAQVENYAYGIALGKSELGRFFMLSGNYPASLKNLLEALALFKDQKNQREIVNTCFTISSVYDDLKQHEKAIYYAKEIIKIAKKNNYHTAMATVYANLAYYYTTLKLYKEALKYCNLQQETIQTHGIKGDRYLAILYVGFGNVYMGMEQYDLGVLYLRKAIALAEKSKDIQLQHHSYKPLTSYFEKTGRIDSARYYGQKTLNIAKVYGYDAEILAAIEHLARLNVNHDNNSAIKLYQEAISINKRLFDTEKTRQVENLTIGEQQRQQELLIEQQKAAEEQKQNLQYAAIAVALVAFALLFFLFSHSVIATQRTIKFLGILSLLVVFEFINLLIHPYIGNLTHHSPVLMLLFMVCLAALLIPLHHKLEHWVTDKMVEKNNKIRLASAKKTIAELEKDS